jgi:GTP-binding protein
MAFIDDVTIHAEAGHGGPGVIRWLRLKGMAKGGPAGGDGGNGGDVVLVGARDLSLLQQFRFEKTFRAENGDAGENKDRYGQNGEDLVLRVPIGTLATIGERSFEVLHEGERTVVFKGGRGGRGNARFKSSTNQNPFHQTDGKPAEKGDIRLTLKIIADAGFVGYPNAGKSSLLNALTNAKSKVGAYPFTTLDPHLGDFYGHILADIPGLIEGASSGKGLGSKFLKHIERTGFIIHLVSAETEDLAAAYTGVKNELNTFAKVLEDKDEVVVLSKADLLTPIELKKALATLSKVSGKKAIAVSVNDPKLVKAFSDMLAKQLTVKESI